MSKKFLAPLILHLGIAMLLALSGCAHVAPPTPNSKPNVRLAPAPYFDSRTGIYFPGALANLHRQSVAHLEDKTPGLGVALTYRNSSTKLDIFSYDLGAPLVPIGIDNALIRKSFEDGIANIKRAANKGLYSNLSIQDSDTLTIDGRLFLRARMSYGERMVRKDAALLVSGINGQIVKVRISSASSTSFDFEKVYQHLAEVLAQSRSSGYGGISKTDFSAIERQLVAIDLTDGIEPIEAIAIAQSELIKARLHNRFDPLSAGISKPSQQNSYLVTFQAYPASQVSPTEKRVAFEIFPSGRVLQATALGF